MKYTVTGENLSGLTVDAPGGELDGEITGDDKKQTFSIKWTETGKHELKVSCANPPAVRLEVTVAKLTCEPNPVKTGYVFNPGGGSPTPLYASVTITSDPKDAISLVTTKITGKERAILTPGTPDPKTGTLKIKVGGKSMTPVESPDGDTFIDVKLFNKSCLSVPVIVVIPKAVGTPHPEPKGAVAATNFASSASTTPKYAGSLEANQVHLWTWYYHELSVPVIDQFKKPLDAIYNGQKVNEKDSGGNWRSINVTVTNGAYPDPVGVFTNKTPPPADVRKGGADEKAFLAAGAPTMAIAVGTGVQDIQIQIAGFTLNPGIKKRKVEAIAPNIVNITWPDE